MNTFSESVLAAWHLLASGDSTLWAIVGRSLWVSMCACVLACGLGLLLGAWLGVVRFRGRGLLLTVLNTLLALPSVVVGLFIYLLLSHSGPLGFLGWLFSFKAMVLAQAMLVLPVVTALTRQVIEDAERAHGEQLRSLGAPSLGRALLLVGDERYALVTVLIAAFGRAVSEVGAVMVVGGNIDGFTRVMTTAIALETSKGDLPLALALGVVLLLVVLALNLAISAVRGWRERVDGGTASAMAHVGGPMSQTPPPSPLFALRNVGVHYGAVVALHDVTLTIHSGERVALVGANGSGKSTLLRLLHGLLPHAVGTFASLAPARAQAMLFQRPHMLRASAQSNVALAMWLRGARWREARRWAMAALERVGLAHVAGRNARTLSGGQQQRLALARAWALAPAVLLLDEPTASLDPTAKRDVEALIGEVADGRTVVFASHNLGQVKRLATRVIYLEHGRVLADLPVYDFFYGALPKEALLFVKGELA